MAVAVFLCMAVYLCVAVCACARVGTVKETMEEEGKQVQKTISNDNLQPFHRLASSLSCNPTSFYTKSQKSQYSLHLICLHEVFIHLFYFVLRYQIASSLLIKIQQQQKQEKYFSERQMAQDKLEQ